MADAGPRVSDYRASVSSISEARARAGDWALSAALVAVSVIMFASGGVRSAVLLLAVIAVPATVAVRRMNAGVAAASALAGMALLARQGASARDYITCPLAVLLDFYMLGRQAGEEGRVVSIWVLVLAAVPVIVVDPHGRGPIQQAVTVTLFVALPCAAGAVIGGRSREASLLRDRFARAAREQAERSARAAADERVRIARELHDIVAHGLSVMVIQSVAARRVAGRDRAAAAEALRAVEQSGREALAELRRLVGVLRRSGDDPIAAAGAGLVHIGPLVRRIRKAGLVVEVELAHGAAPLPAGVDFVAYRIVQEALTNALRYAGPGSTVRVSTRSAGGELVLAVCDDGRGVGVVADGAGARQGLIGMRERVKLFGGELEAGTKPGGGFLVRARIPSTEAIVA